MRMVSVSTVCFSFGFLLPSRGCPPLRAAPPPLPRTAFFFPFNPNPFFSALSVLFHLCFFLPSHFMVRLNHFAIRASLSIPGFSYKSLIDSFFLPHTDTLFDFISPDFTPGTFFSFCFSAHRCGFTPWPGGPFSSHSLGFGLVPRGVFPPSFFFFFLLMGKPFLAGLGADVPPL